MSLIIKNVNKSYGTKKVVNNINLEISKPGVYGLLGTNGAGKTTTIRMLLGILKKDSGEITWNGEEVNRNSVNFGYLPEERGLYPKIKIYDQLLYFAKLKGMKEDVAEKELDYWLDRLKVTEYKNMSADKLSKGNQQKVQFIIAVIHNPELIVLDEPFSGLDPVNSELLKSVVFELVEKGKIIILSSHQMSSVEEFVTDLLILNRGKTILQGNLKSIKNEYVSKKLLIETDSDIENLIIKNNLLINKNDECEYECVISSESNVDNLLKEIVKGKIGLKKFELVKPSLHDIFVERASEGSDL